MLQKARVGASDGPGLEGGPRRPGGVPTGPVQALVSSTVPRSRRYLPHRVIATVTLGCVEAPGVWWSFYKSWTPTALALSHSRGCEVLTSTVRTSVLGVPRVAGKMTPVAP